MNDSLIVQGATRSIDYDLVCQGCRRKVNRLASVFAARASNPKECNEADVCDSCLLGLVFSKTGKTYQQELKMIEEAWNKDKPAQGE